MGAIALSLAAPVQAATPEQRVKAAFLYKLAAFVRWPSGVPGSQFRICVAGDGDIARVAQDLVRGQRIGGAPALVSTIGAGDTDAARTCEVLFVARGADTAHALYAAVDGAPVLTVADRDGGTRGGVVDFAVVGGKVRLMIDRGQARRQQLGLSSKLLDIALKVAP